MLEEALSDPKHPPAATAQAMWSYVQLELEAGGSAAEERFFGRLYPLLCDRVFGKLDEKGDYRHQVGGWLSAQNRWNPRPNNTAPLSASGVSPSQMRGAISLDDDVVVRVLGGALPSPSSKEQPPRTLIEAISAEAERRTFNYPFPFPALPKATQEQVLQILATAFTVPNTHLAIPAMPMPADPATAPVSTNAHKIFRVMLRVKPEERQQLRAFQLRTLLPKDVKRSLQLSPGLASHMATAQASPFQQPPESPTAQETVPYLILSMLEYYLFSFVRFPLAAPLRPSLSPQMAHQLAVYGGGREPWGDTVYKHLFGRYLRKFLPHRRAPVYEAEFSDVERASELFLRVVINFWMESLIRIPTTDQSVRIMYERFRRTGSPAAAPLPNLTLDLSYDLAQGKYEPPPPMVQECLNSLVMHVIADPSIYFSVMDRETTARQWCLSPAVTTLQQPFYNYLRSTLRHASIHGQGSPFFSALDMWLLWVEPWNVNYANKTEFSAQNATKRIISSVSGEKNRTSRGWASPPPNQPSKYDKSWEPYIAANLFMYSVPLAIFLRRSRELDFSPIMFNRSMVVVKRVLRVFTPEVVNAMSCLLSNAAGDAVSYGTTRLSQMLAIHTRTLGQYSPVTGAAPMDSLSLRNCQADMGSLVEEVCMHHKKSVRDLGALDKAVSFIEGLFGLGVVSGEEKSIEYLMERANLITGLPVDHDMFSIAVFRSGGSKWGSASDNKMQSVRADDGTLTDAGRDQIVKGRIKCNPAEVKYIGDKMTARVASHEIPLLVTLTIFVSNWLNKKLGLSDKNKRPFRINLRFLADYRNILFLGCCYMLVKALLF